MTGLIRQPKVPGPTLGDNNFSYQWTWTAISRPPYLTALALWPKQCSGTYFGGGLFITNTHVWLNHPSSEAEPHPNHKPPAWLEVTPGVFDPRYEVGFFRRLHRDGWRIDPEWWSRYAESGFVTAPRALHERAHPTQAFTLMMESNIFYNHEPYRYVLQDNRRGELMPLEGAAWADWDQRGRLVYAKQGKLYAIEIDKQGVADPVELANFNSHRPEPIESPAWAKTW